MLPSLSSSLALIAVTAASIRSDYREEMEAFNTELNKIKTWTTWYTFHISKCFSIDDYMMVTC